MSFGVGLEICLVSLPRVHERCSATCDSTAGDLCNPAFPVVMSTAFIVLSYHILSHPVEPTCALSPTAQPVVSRLLNHRRSPHSTTSLSARHLLQNEPQWGDTRRPRRGEGPGSVGPLEYMLQPMWGPVEDQGSVAAPNAETHPAPFRPRPVHSGLPARD